MPRSPRSTRPRSGRPGRSRPTGSPAAAPDESSSRLLFTARLLPAAPEALHEAALPEESVAEVAVAEVAEASLEVHTPAPTVPPPAAAAVVAAPTPELTGPATRVHAERLVAIAPKLRLTPSQAVRLASEGRDVLTRPRPKAS